MKDVLLLKKSPMKISSGVYVEGESVSLLLRDNYREFVFPYRGVCGRVLPLDLIPESLRDPDILTTILHHLRCADIPISSLTEVALKYAETNTP